MIMKLSSLQYLWKGRQQRVLLRMFFPDCSVSIKCHLLCMEEADQSHF